MAEQLGVMDIQGRQIGHRPMPLVLMFHLHRLAGSRWLGGMDASSGLNAGLFIRRNDELVFLQRLVLPDPLVEIKKPPGLNSKQRITRKNPTAVEPRSNGIFMEPAP